MTDTNIPTEKVQEILTRARNLEALHGERTRLFGRYREMFFMDNIERPKNSSVDRNDWKLTADPSARNEVVGLKRLLDTSDLHVKVLEGSKSSRNSDKIERALVRMLDASGDGRNARVESDAMLAAVLYGPVILSADSVTDLLTLDLPDYKKRHLQKQQKRTPFIIRAINPEESYSERDEGLMTLHLWKYKLPGYQVTSRYGKEAKSDLEYECFDIFTPEYHVVEIKGLGVVFAKAHGLGCIPIVSSYAGGSELFHKPEEQIQSYLYAKAKSELDKRGNSLLTAIFTNIHMRGLLGPLVAVDPDTSPDKIVVDYTGGIRVMRAKATPIDDKVIDPELIQAKQLLDDLSGESTIYKQTLGQNVNAGTFSSLAMLSSAGKLPMVDAQRALQNAFKDIFLHILYRIKEEGIENELIQPAEIPAEVDMEVTFEPKLPQDNLRNAQVAASIGQYVSQEWLHTNLLQVNDSAAMQKQVAKEQIYAAILQGVVQNPQFMQGIMTQIIGQPQQPQQQPQPGQMPQGQPEQMQPPPDMGNGMPPEMTGQMQAQGQPNMEQMPQTDAMIPPQERM